jgi:hypothetical protein
MRDFEASIDDKLLQTKILPSDAARRLWKHAPESWRPPPESPGLKGEETYYVFRGYTREPDLVALSLELLPGPSTLRVRYSAHACGTAERPTVTWQLPYVLAPAREWGGFGQLDVVVHLPSAWEARSTPALERDGDTLRGSFDGVPADALLIATGAPVPAEYHRAVWFLNGLWVAVLVGGPVMCWWVGRRLDIARTRFSPATAELGRAIPLRGLLLQILPGLLWGALIYTSVPVSVGMVKASFTDRKTLLSVIPGSLGLA